MAVSPMIDDDSFEKRWIKWWKKRWRLDAPETINPQTVEEAAEQVLKAIKILDEGKD